MRKTYEGDFELCERLLPALQKIFELIKSSYTHFEDKKGWANDHTRNEDVLNEPIEN